MLAKSNDENFFSISSTNELELNPIIALGIKNATQKFLDTNQNIKDFNIILRDDGESMSFSITPKIKSNQRFLGNPPDGRKGYVIYISKNNGDVVKVLMIR